MNIMAPTSNNQAAWITAPSTKPFRVGPGPEPNPAENEVVIQVAYAAVNPSDWKMQDYSYLPLNYPHVLGSDVAGNIVQVGSAVDRLRVGQRVMGHCAGLLTRKATDGGYQLYTTCLEILVSPIPDSLPFANAAVLPLSISTAAAGLFHVLRLPPPTMSSKPTGKKILIWGGSSSVGSSAIQLAVAAGMTVVTTASARNHEYVKSLGASHVIDHTDPNVVDTVVEILRGGDLAGVFDCISEEKTSRACAVILSQLGGGILPLTLWPPEGLPSNVKAMIVNALDPGLVALDVGDAIWRKFIPAALADGKFLAKPDPCIIEGGLGKMQEANDLLKAGVSAKKIVVEISTAV